MEVNYIIQSAKEGHVACIAIRLKANQVLYKEAGALDQQLYEQTREDTVSYAVVYGDFIYQAGSWDIPRRVTVKIEKPADSMEHRFTFIVLDSATKISCFS